MTQRSGKRTSSYSNRGSHRYTRRTYAEIRRRRKRKRLIIGISIAAAVLLVGFFVWFFLFPVRPSFHSEAGKPVTIGDLMLFPDPNASFTEDSEEFDTSVPGVYHLKIKSRAGVYSCTLTIEDKTAPVVKVQDLIIGKGETCEASDFIVSVEDVTATRAHFVKEPDFSIIGEEQEIVFDVMDESGNRVEKTAKLLIIPIRYRLNLEAGSSAPDISAFTGEPDADPSENYFITDVSTIDYNVIGDNDIELMYHGTKYPAKICIVDTQPPQFTSAEDFTVFLGDPIRYKEHITISDLSGECEIEVDTSAVDTSACGTYPVTYTVTDSSGNSASVTVQVTIVEKTADEAALFERVDAILSEIITDDMSKEEQVWAIYGWIRSYVGWQNESPKDNYIKAAERALDWGSGDCYAYFSISKVMLDRVGIKNKDIERIPDGDEAHYWNLVDIEDGHGWYHFDSTPFEPIYTACLLTDEELMAFNSYGQYNYDRTLYPDIK